MASWKRGGWRLVAKVLGRGKGFAYEKPVISNFPFSRTESISGDDLLLRGPKKNRESKEGRGRKVLLQDRLNNTLISSRVGSLASL